jgi:6-phosphogluconate dehydrogenase
MSKAQFGMVGLGTMGRNFLLNVAGHGFSCIGYDLDAAKRTLLLEEGKDVTVAAAENVPAFIAGLETPRRIMLLVPAGPIVDAVITELVPHLEPGDLVIDGGNSHFEDTERREKLLNEKNIEFLGVGVSGGEEGARHGASIMIGGNPDVYEHVRPMLEAASAKVNGEPCAAHVGRSSAGHFVKMVHNGIEYGLMQLISEAYDLLKRGYRTSTEEIAALFAEWNEGDLNSFLIEISATVLKKQDDKTGQPLVDLILDTAGQKGTGRWTSQVAMDFGVPIPTIDSAVTMRQISARKAERVAAAKKLGVVVEELSVDEQLRESTIEFVREGLLAAFITTYAQGLSLLKTASAEKNYELDMVEIAKIWRGGCIIRAKLLEDIRQAFAAEPDLENILVSDVFVPVLRRNQALLKAFVHFALSADVPCMSAAASLNYLKAYSTERLPANLIQAQRDYFGAHTYQRIDEDGIFHTPDWDGLTRNE